MSQSTVALPPEDQTLQAKLQAIVNLTNEISFAYHDGERSTCILTSYALVHVLQQLGYDEAHPVRVQALASPPRRGLKGCFLGLVDAREAAAPGGWHGHLAVAIGKEWLLDPTLDQINNPEWGDARVGPVVIKLSPEWWVVNNHLYLPKSTVTLNGVTVDYKLYPKQVGFAKKPAARPSRWRPLANEILSKIPELKNENGTVASKAVQEGAGDDERKKAA